MELLLPKIGLVVWSSLSFAILVFILGKYAWKPITQALKEREDSITSALQAADKAREQMQALQADNERLLKQAREERDQILKEANSIKESIISKATKEGEEMKKRLVVEASEAINREKNMALQELKSQVATLSVDIAEKILRKSVGQTGEHEALINESLKGLNLN